ncbi:MAG: hypothetical protein CME64_15445 [Halobacteriovoraceae bacterium]|nr:hypothetical protein [Halobacteriovoraceae bacterium]|tara:strand:+ start:136161 stop:136631 length:471 start_codon:yes stop_codon:yes gene_type:complete
MKFLILIALALSSFASAQNLLTERIWKISSRKRSIFFDQGVFHSDLKPGPKTLISIRNSYRSSKGYERIVFDFGSATPPKVYGHISQEDKKIRMDFFNTDLQRSMKSVSDVKYLKDISFFNIDKENLSVEISFKSDVSFDIFYLENPGRIVIDAKK